MVYQSLCPKYYINLQFFYIFFTDDLARDAIKEAFRQIEKYTCIQFSPWDGEKDFIEIIKGKG